MGGRIIDGERWIAERMKFLRERLAGELTDDERQHLENELEALSKERPRPSPGYRFPRIFRRRRTKK
ncbi:MAG: hypothetical protein AB1679_29055 [Actinomycetota bacterium]